MILEQHNKHGNRRSPRRRIRREQLRRKRCCNRVASSRPPERRVIVTTPGGRGVNGRKTDEGSREEQRGAQRRHVRRNFSTVKCRRTAANESYLISNQKSRTRHAAPQSGCRADGGPRSRDVMKCISSFSEFQKCISVVARHMLSAAMSARAVAAAVLVAGARAWVWNATVETEYGYVAGATESGNVNTFHSVPFAAPPIGTVRRRLVVVLWLLPCVFARAWCI